MPPAVDHVVHGDPLRAAVLHADLKVILQVGPDPRHVGDHVYAERPQERWRSKSGQLKELRRVERATGKDHLCIRMGSAGCLALPVFDPDRTGPAARRAQIADRGRPATSVARGELEIAGAFLSGPVEIVVARKARLLRGFYKSLTQRMRLAYIGNRERAANAMQRILSSLLVLGAAKIG